MVLSCTAAIFPIRFTPRYPCGFPASFHYAFFVGLERGWFERRATSCRCSCGWRTPSASCPHPTDQGLSLDPKAPHAPKAATAVKLWAEKRAARERRDRRPGIRGLESLAVAALRISQPMKPNQDAKLGGERRSHLCMLSFYSPLHPTAFSAHLGSK